MGRLCTARHAADFRAPFDFRFRFSSRIAYISTEEYKQQGMTASGIRNVDKIWLFPGNK
jgi:hypothetical protein